jgi:hypothetical protein
MDTYNLIILILIIILLILVIRYVNQRYYENFTTQYDNNNNQYIFGNILDLTDSKLSSLLNSLTYTKLFKKQYKITGFYVELLEEGTYKLKLNNSFISYNDNTELKSNKYYDITDLNVKSKNIVINADKHNISKVIIYGFNEYNINSKSNYNNSNSIINFTLSSDIENNKNIKFNNDIEYLINYIELPSINNKNNSNGDSNNNGNNGNDDGNNGNYTIQYKNQLTNSAYNTLYSNIKDLSNKFHKLSTKIYFDKPLLANEIKFNNYSGLLTNTNIKLYGKIATESDIKTYRIELELDKDENNITLDRMKCPPMKDIITRQKLINNLCNSISEKDKIRNHQTNYEKTKKYIGKLKQQERQIQSLKLKLNNLVKDNNNTSLSFKEQVNSIKGMVNEVNVNNPYTAGSVYFNNTKTN